MVKRVCRDCDCDNLSINEMLVKHFGPESEASKVCAAER